jgi:hypothetical protein
MNDNPPAFVRPAFSFVVPENSDADRPLGRVEGKYKTKSLVGCNHFGQVQDVESLNVWWPMPLFFIS